MELELIRPKSLSVPRISLVVISLLF